MGTSCCRSNNLQREGPRLKLKCSIAPPSPKILIQDNTSVDQSPSEPYDEDPMPCDDPERSSINSVKRFTISGQGYMENHKGSVHQRIASSHPKHFFHTPLAKPAASPHDENARPGTDTQFKSSQFVLSLLHIIGDSRPDTRSAKRVPTIRSK